MMSFVNQPLSSQPAVPAAVGAAGTVSRIEGPNGSYANVSLAFVFDGYQAYANGVNLSQPLTLLLPTIITWDPTNGPIPYSPSPSNYLIMWVSSLKLCLLCNIAN